MPLYGGKTILQDGMRDDSVARPLKQRLRQNPRQGQPPRKREITGRGSPRQRRQVPTTHTLLPTCFHMCIQECCDVVTRHVPFRALKQGLKQKPHHLRNKCHTRPLASCLCKSHSDQKGTDTTACCADQADPCRKFYLNHHVVGIQSNK